MADVVIEKVVGGIAATDGAGVRLTRVVGHDALPMLDPFLMLDAFRSDDPDDYIAGFPSHPHRGFETVTYLINGRLRHKDNTGREGVIEPGGVQWMTAGRGIIHSEMPEQIDGLLEGFQLWINLPAANKMDAPRYQEFDADRIPVENREGGVTVRVIAGVTGRGTRGAVEQPLTDPLYLDIELLPGAAFREALPAGHRAIAFVVEGLVRGAGAAGNVVECRRDQLAILSPGSACEFSGGDEGARVLLIAGRPLNEPVARGGPFVMNTREQVMQAFADYQAGRFQASD